MDNDGCSHLCEIEEPDCGNGVLDAGEDCDDGNLVNGDGCSSICEVELCGDGVVDPGEACDDGNVTAGDGCSATCTVEECGNGVVDAGEACDDGNVTPGDGCSATCTIEAGVGTVEITRSRYVAAQERVRVRGNVSPAASSAVLFIPGSDAGATCSGTMVAVLPVGVGGGFVFNSGAGAFPVDPGEVCVQSDNGAAVSLITTP